MTEMFEQIVVGTEVVCCNGDGGTLGHPAVYLNLTPKGEVTCPYCSRQYVLKTASKTMRKAG